MLDQCVQQHGHLRSFAVGDSSLKKMKVFVAEDNPAMLRQICRFLEHKFEILGTADNGFSALKLIRQRGPDVVVLDLGMPVLDGMAVVRCLKQSRSAAAIVICSADTESLVIGTALAAGALGFVSKMSMSRDLIVAVEAAARGEIFVSRS
jgi:DNA-binding NarL/FixJ family response regulator